MKAAVIGGGFAGIVAALDLRERGHEVVLLERRGVPGGRATSYGDTLSGDDVDSGLHVLFEGYAATLDWLRRQQAEHFLLRGAQRTELRAAAARRLLVRPGSGPPTPAIAARVDELLAGDPSRPIFLRAGLGRLQAHLVQRLVAQGGAVSRRALVQRVEVEHGRVRRVHFIQRPVTRDEIREGRRPLPQSLEVDYAVVAVPWHAVVDLFDEPDRHPSLLALSELLPLPAVTLEAWLDGVVPLGAPLVSGPSATVDWIADKGRLHGREGAPQHLAFSMAADEGWRRRSTTEWTATARQALEATLAPAAAPALQRSVLVREPLAFYACDAATSRIRAAAQTGIEGVSLAGDWTEADLPPCIEGAVRSGLRAAEGAASR